MVYASCVGVAKVSPVTKELGLLAEEVTCLFGEPLSQGISQGQRSIANIHLCYYVSFSQKFG